MSGAVCPEVVDIDIIGHVETSSGRGHKYVFCLMDQLAKEGAKTAADGDIFIKAMRDALLQIISRTCIPNIIEND